VQGRPADAQQYGESGGECGRPERDVQAERLPLEEDVAEDAEHEGDARQRDPESRAPTHGRLFKHARSDKGRL
jgi:hypothetical protein